MQNSNSSALKVIVGLSGGVDSSVAALLLKEQGFEVEGLFMKNWEEDDTAEYCSAKEDLADARQICKILDIPLHTVNFAQEYWQNVFQYFLDEYKQGRTPNPDILCNREIKFKEFLNHAQKLGADFIATGHYAGKGFTNDEHEARFQLLKAFDENKDQTYFLYTLGQPQLAKSLFPLASLSKDRVRALAENYGLPTAEKKDSTGICFIGERKFKTFLQEFVENEPGNIENLDGKVIGQHDGLMFHTLGQRQGLKIGGLKEAPNLPWYVVGKDMTRNVLMVAQGTDHEALFSDTLIASQLHWVRGKPGDQFDCCAKVRYRQAEQPCSVEIQENGTCKVTFKNQQRAVTPGQSVVFYNSQECLGGGVIESTNALLGLKPSQQQEKAIII